MKPLTARHQSVYCALLCVLAGAGTPALAEPLVPDIPNLGEIAGSSDIDIYEFDVSEGQTYVIRSADLSPTGFCLAMVLYDPLGDEVGNNFVGGGCPTGTITARAVSSGLYRLEVFDAPSIGQTGGAYQLTLVLIPGSNQGGQIPNGGSVIDTLEYGDLDTFTIFANEGDGIAIRGADLNAVPFAPFLNLYDPDGQFVWGASGIVSPVEVMAQQTGTYTLLVGDNVFLNASVFSGNYEVHLARVPGASGDGTLVPGDSVAGEITIGDLDSFSFFAAQGEQFELRLNQVALAPFTSVLGLFDPTGVFLGRVNAAPEGANAPLTWTANVSGAYTAIVSDDLVFSGSTGPYVLSFDKPLELCVDSEDADLDGIPDSCDNCANIANVSQNDGDQDGFGNSCDSDFNNDCIVNVIDLGSMRAAFFSDDAVIDVNSDGIVNIVDLGILRASFFQPPGPSALSSCD